MTSTAKPYAFPAIRKKPNPNILNHLSSMCSQVYLGGETSYSLLNSRYQEQYGRIPLNKNMFGDLAEINYIIGEDEENVYLCLSGTNSLEFWLYNTDTEVTVMKPNGKLYYVHQGFYELTMEVLSNLGDVLKEILDGRNLYLCGHSAGGAVANLAALHLIGRGIASKEKTIVVDFGCPKFWATKNKEEYPIHRVSYRNLRDIVPDVPFRFLTWFRRFKDTERILIWTDSSKLNYIPQPSIIKRMWSLSAGWKTIQSAHKMQHYEYVVQHRKELS